MSSKRIGAAVVLASLFSVLAMGQAREQTRIPSDQIDPARQIASPRLERDTHKPLPEQYIWTAEDRVTLANMAENDRAAHSGMKEHHFFRRTFDVSSVPGAATLYVAGPRAARIFVNGKLAKSFEANPDGHVSQHVIAVDVSHALQAGRNVIAIDAVRGFGANHSTNVPTVVQLTVGKAMVVKLVAAPRGLEGPTLVMSDGQWKASMTGPEGWEAPGFSDAAWPAADSLGGIENSIEMFQWNADAGMYDWPGYDGISPFLAQAPLRAVGVDHVFADAGALENVSALTGGGAAEFRVDLPEQVNEQQAPHVLLDFGRDTDGRLHFVSDSDDPAEVTVQYGESEDEALEGPYLGTHPLYIPPHGSVYGPKSAFRYALVRFISGQEVRFKSIDLETIFYPVDYKGSFESSDAKLNLMWSIGAYTAHLCMQDDIWDAPKRDRGRWMGDLEVSGRTIEDAFGDRFLMEETLNSLMGPAPVKNHVNFIAGYSAFWILGEAEYYRHTGSKEQLASYHERLIQLMHFMETELDERNLYANKTHAWPFVDWSPELSGDTSEARRATEFEFYGAFEQGVWLLEQMGDTAAAREFGQKAAQMKSAAQRYLVDNSTHAFGPRWQTNAIAVVSGAADASQYDAIWRASLGSVGKIPYNAYIVTPYYNYYVISAMAKMNHRKEALDWIRQYWGGMLEEGATSFWEGYDPAWYKDNYHASLQADGGSGYFVSLAHGWSSGVTPWLMEQVLGIQATGPGFSTVDIRPDLVDLKWAHGGEPTPRGMLNVSLKKAAKGLDVAVDLPAGTVAHVSVPAASGSKVTVNGQPHESQSAEGGSRAVVTLKEAGHFEIVAQ
jgi:alpha-L-rhamnosidase